MVKIGLFRGTVWRLAVFGILGCFIGRLHIFGFSTITNMCRTTAHTVHALATVSVQARTVHALLSTAFVPSRHCGVCTLCACVLYTI
jgi:hypothetical protein